MISRARTRFARLCRPGILAVLCLFATPGIHAEDTPAWAKPYFAGEAATWRKEDRAVAVFVDVQAQFVALDRITLHTRSVVRANTREGSSDLKLAIPYLVESTKIDAVRAWLVAPSGKAREIPRRRFSDVSRSTDLRSWNNARLLVYDPGEVDPGTVMVAEVWLESPAPLHNYSGGLPPGVPVYHAEFSVAAAPGARLVTRVDLPSGTVPKASPDGRLTWTMDRVLAVGPGVPEGFVASRGVVRCRCVAADAPPADWVTTGAKFSDFFSCADAAAPEVQSVADEALKGQATRWARIRALCEAVQRKVTYLSATESTDVFAGFRPHPPGEVLKSGLGDCKDKTTLLISLLRAAGEPAYPVLVNAVNRAAMIPDWPDLVFNHVITAIPADAETPATWPLLKLPSGRTFVLFDPTSRLLPLGCLPNSDMGGHGLFLDGDRSEIADLTRVEGLIPSPTCALVVHLKSDGSASVAHAETYCAEQAANLHASHEAGTSRDELTRTLESRLRARGLITKGLQWTTAWDAANLRWTVKADYQADGVARRVGADQLLLTPSFLPLSVKLTPWETKFPGLSWLPQRVFEDEIRIVPPAGAKILDVPPAFREEAAGSVAELNYKKDGETLVCTYRFSRPAGLYSRKDYNELRFLAEKLMAARRRPVLFQTAPAG